MRTTIFTLACIAAILTSAFSQNESGAETVELLDKLNSEYHVAIDALDKTYQMIRAEISDTENSTDMFQNSDLAEHIAKRIGLSWDAVFRIITLVQDAIKFVVNKILDKKKYIGDSSPHSHLSEY